MIKPVVQKFRNILGSSNLKIFKRGCLCLRELSNVMNSDLDKHLNLLLSQLVKNVNKPPFRKEIMETLSVLEQNGVIIRLLIIGS